MSTKTHALASSGPVPECWNGIFFRRQNALRKKLAAMLKSAPACGYLAAGLKQNCWYWETEEIDYALEHMVADGAATLVNGRYTTSAPAGETLS